MKCPNYFRQNYSYRSLWNYNPISHNFRIFWTHSQNQPASLFYDKFHSDHRSCLIFQIRHYLARRRSTKTFLLTPAHHHHSSMELECNHQIFCPLLSRQLSKFPQVCRTFDEKFWPKSCPRFQSKEGNTKNLLQPAP